MCTYTLSHVALVIYPHWYIAPSPYYKYKQSENLHVRKTTGNGVENSPGIEVFCV